MDGGLIERFETGAEQAAAAVFAASVGYAAYGFVAVVGFQPQFALAAGAAGALSYLPCRRAMGLAANRQQSFVLAAFSPRECEFPEVLDELELSDRLASPDELLLTDRLGPKDELLLTEVDRVERDSVLLLDDVVGEPDPDSRVVRMFDRKAMPVAPQAAPSDASQALSAALAELRRSLR